MSKNEPTGYERYKYTTNRTRPDTFNVVGEVNSQEKQLDAVQEVKAVQELAKYVDDVTNLSIVIAQNFDKKITILQTKLANITNNTNETTPDPKNYTTFVPEEFNFSKYGFNYGSIKAILKNVTFLNEMLLNIQQFSTRIDTIEQEIDLASEKCKTSSITTGGSKYSKKRRVNRNKRLSKRKSSTRKSSTMKRY